MSHSTYLLSCFLSFFIGFGIAFFNRERKYKTALTKDLTFTERNIVSKLMAKKGIKL